MNAERSKGGVALVTGGSRGIGRAVVVALARDGWRVAVNYRGRVAAAAEVCAEVERIGGEARAFRADVGDADQVVAMFTAIKRDMGSPGVLVNNAGITADGPLVFMKDDAWDSVLRTNLTGAFNCSRKAIRAMIAHKWGRIVNIVSPSGLAGRSGQANYSAAKGGLAALTKTMARELAGFGITCNAVSPGVIETEMTSSLPDDVKAEFLGMIPLKRFGSPADVAGVVAFLVSPAADYITGQILHVDGGILI
ncbi:3-oxoacyl-ACP reductase FabG [bacterium]|nr:3-oxoacyl-ACP reductase FabG [candidate division CSSED10-310 bacterium]